jgi:hypothetical protein
VRASSCKLNRMERLAASGIQWRFERETREALVRRNRDLLAILEEHGHHDVPQEFAMLQDAEGYITQIHWDDDRPNDADDHHQQEQIPRADA